MAPPVACCCATEHGSGFQHSPALPQPQPQEGWPLQPVANSAAVTMPHQAASFGRTPGWCLGRPTFTTIAASMQCVGRSQTTTCTTAPDCWTLPLTVQPEMQLQESCGVPYLADADPSAWIRRIATSTVTQSYCQTAAPTGSWYTLTATPSNTCKASTSDLNTQITAAAATVRVIVVSAKSTEATSSSSLLTRNSTMQTSSSSLLTRSSSYTWHTGSGGPATHYTEGEQPP